MSASPAQRAARQAVKTASIALARDGHDTAAIAKILSQSPRYIRACLQGEDLSPPPPAPDPADSPSRQRPKSRRRAPKAFKAKNQGIGRALRPIILDDGGFGIRPGAISTSAFGPNIAVGDTDEFGRVKMSEQVVDMGTTEQVEQRRYDNARTDESWDDFEIPEGATRAILVHEDGSRTEVDLTAR